MLVFATRVLTPGAKALMYEASSIPSTKFLPVSPFHTLDLSNETSLTEHLAEPQ